MESVLCPKAFSENDSNKKKRLTGGVPHVRFKRGNRVRRRQRPAVIAGDEPLRGRERGRYRRVQEALPRRWVVEVTEGRDHNDGDFLDGGRRRRAMMDLTGRGF